MAPTVLQRSTLLLAIVCFAPLLTGADAEAQQASLDGPRDPAGRGERAGELTARAERLIAAGDPGSAVWYLREALRVDPAFAPAAAALADVYLARRETTTALDVLNDAVARAPGHAVLWLRLSRVLWLLDEQNDAVEALREGLRHDPQNPELLRELADRSLQRGEWLRALSTIRALQPSHANAADGDAQEALRVLVGTSDRARGLRCEPALSSVRRALCGCSSAR